MGADAMNACKQTQALLFEKADGRVDGDARAAMDAHLATCLRCKQVFAAWTSALPRVRGLAPDDPSAVGERRMENEVLRQLRGTAAAPRARRRAWFALAAGLALAVLGGLASLRFWAPQPFARIQTMWGRVTLAGAAMTTGAAIGPGGVLEIAAEGEATLVVGRAADVQLFGPGRVALGGTRQGPRLRLDSGRLAVQIAHRRSDEGFTVATAHGRVEVRGTRFIVGYAGQGSYVHVDEGEVGAFRDGNATSFPVTAGETFWLKAEVAPETRPAPAPPSAATELRPCPAASCTEAVARARRAMRGNAPTRAVDIVEEALGQLAECSRRVPGAAGTETPPANQRCVDELGYLRAEALRRAGRLEAAIGAFRSLNRASATRAMSQNALYAAAQLERQLGRTRDARQTFERAYAAHPDGALAEEAMAAILDLVDPTSAQAHAAAQRYLARYPRGAAAARARRILAGAPGSHAGR
jgi:ferric-dicitrate binding protein FerR (iron transport regulator)/TolA-binding protein